MQTTPYRNFIGLDPGHRLMIAGTQNGKPLKIKNSYFQHLSGYYSRKRKLERYTKGFVEHTQLSPMSANFHQYVKYQLEIFLLKQTAFGQRKVTRLKLKKYICRKRACNEVARQLVPDRTEPTLICLGSTECSANSPIRGYICLPNRELIKSLRERHGDILLVNEFRTTKLCHRCHGVIKTSKSPHRYQFCPECGNRVNRDVNAGINILYKGLCEIYQIDLSLPFQNI